MSRSANNRGAPASFRQSVIIDPQRYPELAYMVDMQGWGVRAAELIRLARLGAICEQQQRALLDRLSTVAQLQALAQANGGALIDPNNILQLQATLAQSSQPINGKQRLAPEATARHNRSHQAETHEAPSTPTIARHTESAELAPQPPEPASRLQASPSRAELAPARPNSATSSDNSMLDTFVL